MSDTQVRRDAGVALDVVADVADGAAAAAVAAGTGVPGALALDLLARLARLGARLLRSGLDPVGAIAAWSSALPDVAAADATIDAELAARTRRP